MTASSPARHRGALRFSLAVALVCTAMLLAGCPRRHGPTPKFLGDAREVSLKDVAPAFRDDVEALEAARAADAGSQQTAALAEALLARRPPEEVRRFAWRAQAEHAWLNGDDAAALTHAEQGLADLEAAARETGLGRELSRLRLRALARGGEPTLARQALADEAVAGRVLEDEERRGLFAVVSDRAADAPAAVRAFARWREVLADDEPTAVWAEQRLRTWGAEVEGPRWADALADLEPGPARACVDAMRSGTAADASMPAWVRACGRGQIAIGILLPRTGPLSALADEQLAAAVVGVELLAADGVAAVMWHDSGSDKAEATRGAAALLAGGATVLVGPVGADNVGAVATEVAGRARVVVPAEPRKGVVGVAPSLEARMSALVQQVRAAGKKRLVLLAPDNSYGKRAGKAAKSALSGSKIDLVLRDYPAGTTSFASVLSPVMTALSSDGALLVADHLQRTELVLRQLLRDGKVPARGSGSGLWVGVSAEGMDPAIVLAAGEVFEGVFAAPVAVADSDHDPFVAAYQAQQGTPPTDQALLVWRALQVAAGAEWAGDLVTVVRFSGGRATVVK